MSVVYSGSAAGLRAGQSGTMDAIAQLHSTMSASLIKDLLGMLFFSLSLFQRSETWGGKVEQVLHLHRCPVLRAAWDA